MSAVSSRWYWCHAGKRSGPVTWDELQALAKSGRLQPDDPVLREGCRTWQPARTARETEEASPSQAASAPPVASPSTLPPLMALSSPAEGEGAFISNRCGVRPGRMLLGACLFVGGIISTWAGHSAAASQGGGTYIIFTGPIIYGLYFFLNSFGTHTSRAETL